MVNDEIPIIAMERNWLGGDWRAEARDADGLSTDRSKQMIARSALVIHNVKKHRNYQFMNVHFGRARRFMGRKV
jgi:hypothetical protein